jgi:hypothetical protein
MAQISTGSSTAGKANVDSNFNLNVNTPTTEAQAGFVALSSEVDAGGVTGTRYQKALEVSDDYRLRVGIDVPMFNLSFEGTIVARDRIQQNDLSAMTAAQASGFLTINSSNLTTSGAACNVRTYRTFPIFGSFAVYADLWIREGNPTATNAVSEWGLGYATGVAAPTDGVFFRRLSGGQLRAVVCFNSSETVADITTTNVPPRDEVGSFDPTEANHYLVSAHNDDVEFWINDTLVAKIPVPSTQGSPALSSTQPLFARVYNSGIASAGRRVELGFLQVAQGDMGAVKPWSHIMAGTGASAYTIQPGTTSGPTVLRTAATNGWPASAILKTTNAWAASTGPADGSLGGRWLSPAISTLTTEVDYPLFSYLNPAGTATLGGRTLYVTSIRVGETIATAAAATNGIMLVFCAGGGSTAASFATADAAATVAPRLVPLGSCYFLSTAAIGQTAAGFTVDLSSAPLVVPPGTYCHIVCRPVGTVASNTLVVTGTVTVCGYFE